MKLVIYGGQYGSEGKGSASEWLIKNTRRDGKQMVAIGENSPNSGHTCSLGKTRNIPAASYFSDAVLLGPDSAINIAVLLFDLVSIRKATGKAPRVYIHEHAAVVCDRHAEMESKGGSDSVVGRISSTGSGSGAARTEKQYLRLEDAVIKTRSMDVFRQDGFEVVILNRFQYQQFVRGLYDQDCVFECSQGTLLDVNFGIYPYVTSRSTLPRVAVERNGLATLPWAYFGVYRTFPIRTGGPSGPTGGDEVAFDEIGVEPEIATVTKRIRRIFKFNRDDFELSLNLTRPACVMFTHLDYISVQPTDLPGFLSWYNSACGGAVGYAAEGLFLSNRTGEFHNHQLQPL